MYSCFLVGLVVQCGVCVCVRVKPEALLLLLTKTSVRGEGNNRYEVPSHLHLTLCSEISQTLKDAYIRVSHTQFWRAEMNASSGVQA